MEGSTAYKEIVPSKGHAVGKLTRFNHIVLICRDMEESVTFYRDILGLKVVGTSGGASQTERDAADSLAFGKPVRRAFTRQYFFQLGDGELFSLYEVSTAIDGRKQPPLAYWLWPQRDVEVADGFTKLDHLAFNVESIEELEWFAEHLRASGVEVEGPVVATNRWETQPSLVPCRLYFYDPSGNPLEISTQNIGEALWENVLSGAFFKDTDPVPTVMS
jgi:catechol 2,3-dioxygenase-like lactoylglutathione lyase family enzyme